MKYLPKLLALSRKEIYFGSQFWSLIVQDEAGPIGSCLWRLGMVVAECLQRKAHCAEKQSREQRFTFYNQPSQDYCFLKAHSQWIKHLPLDPAPKHCTPIMSLLLSTISLWLWNWTDCVSHILFWWQHSEFKYSACLCVNIIVWEFSCFLKCYFASAL